MKDFRDLKVWQKAHQLVLATYKATGAYPPGETYGLTNQTRRASASISINIAEGCGREGDAEFARFLQIAMGSASEVEYQFLLAKDLGFLKEDVYKPLSEQAIDVKRMLCALLQRLRSV